MFAHQPPPLPSIPFRLPFAEELRTRPSLQQPTGQDDQQQPTRDERPSLSAAGPSLSPFFAHMPVGPAPPAAAAAAGGRGAGGLSTNPFQDMYCVPPAPAFRPPPPPIDPSSLHPIGSPLPGSYNGGPQASGFSPHPFGFPQPCPSSPTPAAAAAAAASDGGGLSADSFFYESGHGGDGLEYDEEGYQPPSSSSAAYPFAAAPTAWAMQGGNNGPSRGFGAVGAGGSSDSEHLVDQLCRQLELKDQQEAKRKDQEAKQRAREAKRRAREVQEAREKEEALVRQLQEAQWTIAKMTAQQSSHHHQQQPSSSSSSSAAPPPSSFAQPHPSTHASTTDHQQQQDGDDGPDCSICFGEHGPSSVMYIPCRHMHICTKCYADRRRAWRQNLPQVRAENARRVEVNKELIKEDKEPMAMLPEGYLCEQCQTEVAFAWSVEEVSRWMRPFVTGAP
ncbi:unnamed protein product [Vitrella brassicaformis CCMP3155]|uniref:RING-type domain-containing protein n=1 Tax=Vitrella brassicaformis (strain CCMP3155) TaxID=1169540 RepID=A0A0G4EHM9_VITBC|nr:unnamed protein product [Vitrella brassicaformis CCMP3155]|eukprot:CEL95488.1 unnamed protein product [Vitrella brassicaformis CCMP3155]